MDTLNLVILLAVAITNLITARIVLGLRDTIVNVAADVLKIEKATNSMQDKLVASTAKASHAEGMADERAATQGETK